MISVCREYGGVFVGLWHNTLWDEEDFPGWGEHFVQSLSIADRERACITSLRGAVENWT